MVGGNGDDILLGGLGRDTISGGRGNDLIDGGDRDDTLVGGDGKDDLGRSRGDDILRGGNDNDRLDGGDGNDVIFGGSGIDWPQGGLGQDRLYGGAQDDTFSFRSVSDSSIATPDIIFGIEEIGRAGGDIIDLSTINVDATPFNSFNPSFNFLGAVSWAEAFEFGSGALWLQDFGGQTRVFGLEDNDDVIDFALWINDGAEVTVDHYIASDFPL